MLRVKIKGFLSSRFVTTCVPLLETYLLNLALESNSASLTAPTKNSISSKDTCKFRTLDPLNLRFVAHMKMILMFLESAKTLPGCILPSTNYFWVMAISIVTYHIGNKYCHVPENRVNPQWLQRISSDWSKQQLRINAFLQLCIIRLMTSEWFFHLSFFIRVN